MPTSPEPRFARVAALIADPTRARMLAVLLGGEYRNAGELATAGGVTPQSASTQLAQLVEHGLVHVRQQGRHKYFALADAEIGHALEALSLVAERDDVSARWQRPAWRPLKCARRCYGHLAGELGVAQFEMLMRRGYLAPARDAGAGSLHLSDAGRAWADTLALELPATTARGAARLAYPCMDWSERRDHLAGTLARALLEHHLKRDWLRADPASRALKLTPRGEQEMMAMLAAG